MRLGPGARLGPYEIQSALGAGGMGEVYKARDTRLDRIVAIKVLPSHVSDDPALQERFEREARTVAALNHSHICTLHDVGRHEGTDYLVLEYLEGQTLAERLTKGALPLDQALAIAIHIADALAVAHRSGVVHRDLKPGNIMLTKSGAKLLDFGLAKAAASTVGVSGFSIMPTAQAPVTAQGTILGTLQYMSPEQLEGHEADARTDIFAFGLVLYEMVTGRKAFEGKSQASLISAIMTGQPQELSKLQPMTPAALENVTNRCLAKDREERWQTAKDLFQELRWISDSAQGPARTSQQSEQQSAAEPWKKPLSFGLVGVLVVVATATITWIVRTPAQEPVSRLAITLPAGQRLASLEQPAITISHNGDNVVYVAVEGGTQRLYLRPLNSLEAKPIAGTEGGFSPFFSPDDQWVGFFAGGSLKKVSINGGGAAVMLATAVQPGGASWSSDGILAFQPSSGSAQGLQQVSQEGGPLQAAGPGQSLTRIVKGEFIHRWPEFLPGGRAVLYSSSVTATAWSSTQVAVQPIGVVERKNLAQGGTQPRYASSGHLLYAQGGSLMAAPFDMQRLAITGPAVPVLAGVMQSTIFGAAQYSLSSAGTLVYLPGGLTANQSQLVWVSRNGGEQLLPAAPRSYQYPRVSPDGRRVAVNVVEQESQNWIYDTSRDTLSRLTFDGSDNNVPVWSPDGKRIAFRSNRTGAGGNLFLQASDGGGGAERLMSTENLNSPSSFSPDGQRLAFMETHPETGRDIWVLSLRDRKAQPFVKTPYEETAPKFSPDGKWLAYTSDESGRREVYVQPYPGPGGKWQISTDGGQEPAWNPKGGELFYRNASRMMVADIDTTSGFAAGKPRMLFEGAYLSTAASFAYYDVAPDGQQFLMLKPVDSQASAPTQINVVQHWTEELKRLVPTK